MSSMFSPIFNDKLFSLITTYVHVHLINHCYMQILSVSFFLVSTLFSINVQCTCTLKKLGLLHYHVGFSAMFILCLFFVRAPVVAYIFNAH